MPCFHPLLAHQRASPGPNGKRQITFSKNPPPDATPLLLPCGRCSGCRLDRAKAWALRCSHEATNWERSSFLTLTYRDADLPPNGTLQYPDFQKFMKRLRIYLKRDHGIKRVSYYMCGEYGEQLSRPHYHCILFGFDFLHDRKQCSKKRGNVLYESETLNKLWGLGFASIGNVTFQSAAYCARYTMKKVVGKDAPDHYRRVNTETGEIVQLVPEFNKMSLNPAIGRGFFEAYSSDIYPDDFCLVDGKKVRSPKYYDRLLEKQNPELLERVKKNREAAALLHQESNTPARRAVREKVLESKLTRLKREYHI